MRCDIESLKVIALDDMVLRCLDLPAARGGPLDPHLYDTQGYMPNMHPVMMTRSNSAMLEMEYRKPSDYEQTENRIDHLKGDMELPQAAEKITVPKLTRISLFRSLKRKRKVMMQ